VQVQCLQCAALLLVQIVVLQLNMFICMLINMRISAQQSRQQVHALVVLSSVD
jgi:hypothetical protein